MRITTHLRVAFMASSHGPNRRSEDYPGPSQKELGGLADWISPTEFAQLRMGLRVAWAFSSSSTHQPRHHRRPARYLGPAREGLGDLVVGRDTPESSRLRDETSSPRSPSLDRAVGGAAGVSEADTGVKPSFHEPAKIPADFPGDRTPGPVVDLMDEIERAIRDILLNGVETESRAPLARDPNLLRSGRVAQG